MEEYDVSDIDYSYESLSQKNNGQLIRIIQNLHNRVDELEGIRYNSDGEEIIGNDELVENGEVVL